MVISKKKQRSGIYDVLILINIIIGVQEVTATHENNRVVVEGSASTDAMLAAIQKTGKKCSLAN